MSTGVAPVAVQGTADTWLNRLQVAIGPAGYDSSNRRSVQTVVLFEANRCIADALPHLRPFQRKVAYIDMANALLDSITFIPPHQRLEIFWRTGTSKEPMNADTAWKRRKLLTKDIERIKEAVTERAANSGLSHEDAIDSYLQNALETTPTGGSVTATIKAWSQAHNNAIMCYRMYYRGAVIDPTFPPPNPPKPIRIVTDKRIALPTAAYYYPPVPPQPLPPTTTSVHPPVAHNLVAGAGAATTKDQEQQQGAALLDIHDRGRLLEEVKEHLELLKQFEGVIPDEEIASRKRELFLALPLPPPPAAKRAKNEDELMTI